MERAANQTVGERRGACPAGDYIEGDKAGWLRRQNGSAKRLRQAVGAGSKPDRQQSAGEEQAGERASGHGEVAKVEVGPRWSVPRLQRQPAIKALANSLGVFAFAVRTVRQRYHLSVAVGCAPGRKPHALRSAGAFGGLSPVVAWP